MVDVCPDEALLLLQRRIAVGVAGIGHHRVVIVVHPLCEMVGKLVASRVGRCILEVNDNQLLMLVGGLQEGRFLIVWSDPENVAILRLEAC